MARRQASSVWGTLYSAERNELLLNRLRWCLALGLVGIVVWSVQVLVDGPAARGVEYLLTYAVVCPGVGALTFLKAAQRRAAGLALGYVLVLTVGVTLLLRHLPEGAEIAPATLVMIALGTTLVLPWGAGPQAVVGAATVGGYAYLHGTAAEPPTLAGAVLVILGAAVALAGAHLFAAYRARLFERTWQQQQLVSLTRELASQLEPTHVMEHVVEQARRLIPAELTIVTEHDARGRLHRVGAVGSNGENSARWLVGLEVPDDFPLLRRIVEREMVRLPEDDPENALLPMLRERSIPRVLYVAMHHGEEVLGTLAFVRQQDVPFAASEQMLARGLADQVALALRNARLITDLRHANQLKSQFVSTMSHELRTPLNVILGFAEMGRDSGVEPTARAECFVRIDAAGRELLSLVESTLDIGRIEAGRDEAQLELVSLRTFWDELERWGARLPRAPEVEVEWATEVPPISIVTDPRKLMVLMHNLVGNALKFTERGRVRIEVAAERLHLVLRVSDTGIGIRPEDQEVIFEMFRQGDGSDSRRYGGTGLGLYIGRRFVQQLGGAIAVDSAPGCGSVFTVHLPLAVADPQARNAA